ncbi:MAG TPA: hypothetical protein VFT72_13255 [Opitutaceae bacterium]|nr:hypothetical protein [Opitutaceae bacterium]
MSDGDPVLIYFILGTAGSGRRAVVADLIDGGLAEDERAVVLLSDNEADNEIDAKLPRLVRWHWNDGQLDIPDGAMGDATHVFLISDGRTNPVDQIEAFKPWLDRSGGKLARVFCVVDSRLAEQTPELLPWYEACIHFSDVVLLTNRAGVANKWISDFQNRFKDQFYPCLFEFVKNAPLKNPPLLLEPEARRMSHLFDEAEWDIIDDSGNVEVDDFEDEDDKLPEGHETTEEIEVVQVVDPYLERRLGGRRVKEIPDVAKYLPPKAETRSSTSA